MSELIFRPSVEQMAAVQHVADPWLRPFSDAGFRFSGTAAFYSFSFSESDAI
ncbi:hypothetical protein MF271_02585 (plasmid) [Deinococcus sp. KNUC1210]|uniref:hypothetical protein n=1 Tax=Deinococcus sp. KNUC1210 TaxID=2917691 RepID=UPI001EEFD960|nr:hypothetical protein [Deinococcus sp. KNUC1210]ULH14183.1 hypothetical protein MF271_02585 [Deinococcus sp. KNUC1210]